MNTRISYQYRDGANNKTGMEVILAGAPDADLMQSIIAAMDCDGGGGVPSFIPGQVGLPDLQNNFQGDTQWDEGIDHPWHELIDIWRTRAEPTVGMTMAELASKMQAVTWDPGYLPPFHDEMVRNRERALAESTGPDL